MPNNPYRKNSIFAIKALDPASVEILENILHKRPRETEEILLNFPTSLPKKLFYGGKEEPLSQLRYDLSYWSDLAKWLMKMQEKNVPYTISYEYSKRNLPNWIQINFQGLEIGFYLSEANLPLIIPALSTVQSPLKVNERYGQAISNITYNKKTGVLNIASKSNSNAQKEIGNVLKQGGVEIEGWTFIPGMGFYAEEPQELLLKPNLEGYALSEALTEHGGLISNFLSNALIHHHSTTVSYQLSFDSKWNLHIKSFIFEPGDLTSGGSRLIGNWVYLDEDGFYPIEEKRFDEVDFIVPISKISDFVTQNRAWLNLQEGFHTHIKSLEYQVSYQLAENRRLTFYRTLSKNEDDLHLHDFGSWVYLQGHGFYSKKGSSFNFLFKSGFSLSPEQIPIFIKMNRDELELIPRFFNLLCPIIKLGLKAELAENSVIKVTPQYELEPVFQNKEVLFFDEFVYVDGYGFYELPAQMRLPDKFRNPVELTGEEVDHFLTVEVKDLSDYISAIDLRLMQPKKIQLVTKAIEMAHERGRGWYLFKLYYQTENGFDSCDRFFKLINKKKKSNYAFFNEGRIDLLDSRYDWLRLLDKNRIDKANRTVLLTTLEFMRLNAFDPMQLSKKADESSIKLYNELIQFKTPEEPNVGGLVSHLRPYQELGVQWLWFLYSQRLSGLLCDDMGFGKTHQAMALLASVENFFLKYAEGHAFHFLIVCPTSVIYHWQDKLESFLPGKRVCTFYGSKRSLEEFSKNYDILLTSYGVLRNEKELLSKIQFEVAIFDEIQVAKNQFSQVYGSLIEVKATMKLRFNRTLQLKIICASSNHFLTLYSLPTCRVKKITVNFLSNRLKRGMINNARLSCIV